MTTGEIVEQSKEYIKKNIERSLTVQRSQERSDIQSIIFPDYLKMRRGLP